MRRVVLPALFIVNLLLAARQTARATSLTFTPIDVPFNGVIFTSSYGINSGGQIVGE